MKKNQLFKFIAVMLVQAVMVLDAAWCADLATLSPKITLSESALRGAFKTLPISSVQEKIEPSYEYKNNKIYKVILRNLFNGEEVVLLRNELFGHMDITREGYHYGVTINSAGFFDYVIEEGSLTLKNIRLASEKDRGLGETAINWLIFLAKEKKLKFNIKDIINPRIVSIAGRLLDNVYVITEEGGKVPRALANLPVPIEKVDFLHGVFDVRISGAEYMVRMVDGKLVESNLPNGYTVRVNKHGYLNVMRQGKVLEGAEVKFSAQYGYKILSMQGNPNPITMVANEDGTIAHYQNGKIIRSIDPQRGTVSLSKYVRSIWRRAKTPKEFSRDEERKVIIQALKTGDVPTKQLAAERAKYYLRNSDKELLDLLITLLKDSEDEGLKLKIAEALAEKKHALYAILDENTADLQTLSSVAYALSLAGEKDERIVPLILRGLPRKKEIAAPEPPKQKFWLQPIDKICQAKIFSVREESSPVEQAI